MEIKTCYDCTHVLACKYTLAMVTDKHPPYKSDAHIAPFLQIVNEAFAEACGFYEEKGDDEK